MSASRPWSSWFCTSACWSRAGSLNGPPRCAACSKRPTALPNPAVLMLRRAEIPARYSAASASGEFGRVPDQEFELCLRVGIIGALEVDLAQLHAHLGGQRRTGPFLQEFLRQRDGLVGVARRPRARPPARWRGTSARSRAAAVLASGGVGGAAGPSLATGRRSGASSSLPGLVEVRRRPRESQFGQREVRLGRAGMAGMVAQKRAQAIGRAARGRRGRRAEFWSGPGQALLQRELGAERAVRETGGERLLGVGEAVQVARAQPAEHGVEGGGLGLRPRAQARGERLETFGGVDAVVPREADAGVERLDLRAPRGGGRAAPRPARGPPPRRVDAPAPAPRPQGRVGRVAGAARRGRAGRARAGDGRENFPRSPAAFPPRGRCVRRGLRAARATAGRGLRGRVRRRRRTSGAGRRGRARDRGGRGLRARRRSGRGNELFG